MELKKASLARLSLGRIQLRLFAAFISIVVFPSLNGAVQAENENMRIRRPVNSGAGTSAQIDGPPEQMQIRLNLPDNRPGQYEGRAQKDASDPLKGGLTQIELNRLASHDIVLLIDKSGSMRTPDCPIGSGKVSKITEISALVLGLRGVGGLADSRWDWCLHQTANMVKLTESVLRDGFTVVLFDSKFDVFTHVTVQQLSRIFSENHPSGGTDLSGPFASTFNDYFRRKKQTKGNIKPLLIGVITDGCPNYPIWARQAVLNGTRQMTNPNEITIIFFLIGSHDGRGEQFVWDLSHNLTAEGARYQIVRSVPFPEVERLGLARALADNLR